MNPKGDKKVGKKNSLKHSVKMKNSVSLKPQHCFPN